MNTLGFALFFYRTTIRNTMQSLADCSHRSSALVSCCVYLRLLEKMRSQTKARKNPPTNPHIWDAWSILSPFSSKEICSNERGVLASSIAIRPSHIVLARMSILAGCSLQHNETYTCAPTTPYTAALDPMLGLNCQTRSSTTCWALERVNHASLHRSGTHCHDHSFLSFATFRDHSRSSQ